MKSVNCKIAFMQITEFMTVKDNNLQNLAATKWVLNITDKEGTVPMSTPKQNQETLGLSVS